MTEVRPYDEDDDGLADDAEPRWWSPSSLLVLSLVTIIGGWVANGGSSTDLIPG